MKNKKFMIAVACSCVLTERLPRAALLNFSYPDGRFSPAEEGAAAAFFQ